MAARRNRTVTLSVVGLALAACNASAPLGTEGSPAGGFACILERDGNADVARIRLRDGKVAPITSTPRFEERWPYWSPHARHLVFERRSYASGPRSDLVLWDVDSGEERFLGTEPPTDQSWPAWSPVRAELVYTFHAGPLAGVALVQVTAGQAPVTRVLASAGPGHGFLRPVWSRDGAGLVIQRRSRANNHSHLWYVPLDGKPDPLTEGDVFDFKAQFSSDGRRLYFTRSEGPNEPGTLMRLDLDLDGEGGTPAALWSRPGTNEHSLKPSPTRDELVFVSDRDGSFDLFLLGAAGEPRNLTRTDHQDEFAPQWSPDGELLLFLVREADGAQRSAVIDRTGRTLMEAPCLMAEWMPAWP